MFRCNCVTCASAASWRCGLGWLDIKIQSFYGDIGHVDVRICKDVLMDVTSHISSMECMGLPGLVLTWDQWGMRRREWQCSVDKWGFPRKLCSLGQSLLHTRLVRSDEWIQFGFNVMICFFRPKFQINVISLKRVLVVQYISSHKVREGRCFRCFSPKGRERVGFSVLIFTYTHTRAITADFLRTHACAARMRLKRRPKPEETETASGRKISLQDRKDSLNHKPYDSNFANNDRERSNLPNSTMATH